MAAPLEQFVKLPFAARAGVTAGLVVLLLVGYYFFFYSSLSAEKESLLAQQAQLEQEKASYEARVQDYLAFRNEVAKLLEEQKELLRILPKDAEIPAFLEQIHQQAELVGVDVLEFTRNADMPKDFFAKIPVSMRVEGNYHRVAKFFRNVGELKRIVNIEGLRLARTGSPTDREITLVASFTASTFRFMDKTPGATTPPPGGQ